VNFETNMEKMKAMTQIEIDSLAEKLRNSEANN
jgi:hypothetical protein